MRAVKRYCRPICTLLVSLVILITLILRRHRLHREHDLLPALLQPSFPLTAGDKQILTTSKADSLCQSQGFRPFRGSGRKVYDLILFSTELDWLEIRLKTLSYYVDYFVIVESPTTFTGSPKPLNLKDNWDRFEEFQEKIIYRVVEDNVSGTRIWDHEDFLLDSLLYEVFPGLAGTFKAALRGDVLIVSDMDEVLRPSTLTLLRYCHFPARLSLRTEFFYYSFQWRHHGEQWVHPEATVYGGSIESTLSPNDLRMGLLGRGFLPLAAFRRWWDRGTLWNAGWHCSSCFLTIAEMQTKMNSFSHQGWNTADNRNATNIVDRVRNGLDLFAREGEIYDRVLRKEDIPEYIKQQYQQHGRFKYLVDRLDEHAAFEDWETAL